MIETMIDKIIWIKKWKNVQKKKKFKIELDIDTNIIPIGNEIENNSIIFILPWVAKRVNSNPNHAVVDRNRRVRKIENIYFCFHSLFGHT